MYQTNNSLPIELTETWIICFLFWQDSFYHNLSDEELARVHEYNFDHPGGDISIFLEILINDIWPFFSFLLQDFLFCCLSFWLLMCNVMVVLFSDAFDTEQLLSAMEKLSRGNAADIPNYDFKSYKNNIFPARRVKC